MKAPRRSGFQAPENCPVCGADVPRGSLACPECGADERSGWDEEKTRYDGLDLPEEAFEDESAGKHRAAPRKNAVSTLWIIVGIVLLAALVVSLVL